MQQVKPKEAPAKREEIFVRMNTRIYESLEAKLPQAGVTATTTELQAGFQLGIQYVLKLLREGYVISKD